MTDLDKTFTPDMTSNCATHTSVDLFKGVVCENIEKLPEKHNQFKIKIKKHTLAGLPSGFNVRITNASNDANEVSSEKKYCFVVRGREPGPPQKKKVAPIKINLSNTKISRPQNAFMVFAKEMRKKTADKFPSEVNKEISVRLGLMWKNLSVEGKRKYYQIAQKLANEHKKKYPGRREHIFEKNSFLTRFYSHPNLRIECRVWSKVLPAENMTKRIQAVRAQLKLKMQQSRRYL